MMSVPSSDALLVALVLCPGAYSRNRFYAMYATPEAAAVRRRASLVRSIVSELAHPDPLRRGRVTSMDDISTQGHGTLTYVVSSLGLKRSTLLSALELSIIQYAVSRKIGISDGFDADESSRERLEIALCGLSPEIADSARQGIENELFDGETDESVWHNVQHEG